MGDFLLDFRSASERQPAKAAELLRFTDHTRAVLIDEPAFSLVLTLTEAPEIWGPFRSAEGTLVAVAGRVALSEEQWQAGEAVAGMGGLAGKAVHQLYRDGGLAALEGLGGNCVLLVYDASQRAFHLITDAAGAFPAFRLERHERLVFGSHPDVLAVVAGEQNDLDEVSLTEFLLTSTVTPSFTYYRRIRAVAHGTVTTIHPSAHGATSATTRQYFDSSFQSPTGNEDDLAEELALAFQNSVRRRTLRRFGRTAIALSGGLDSRMILACIENRDQVFAFCCFNEPNRELAVAEALARALAVPFLPCQRGFDYYADNAERGVRISGGMGTFANNHFLGVVDRLRAEGAQNLLTGCYVDYLFKGLPLNRSFHWLTGREQLAPFRHQFYFDHFDRTTPFADQLRQRWESRVPGEFQNRDTDQALHQIEARRTFPLSYEGDNQQRLVPQRVTGWYLPMADRAILDVYRKIPSRFKLNRSLYSKAVRRLCNGPLSRIPDANTGAKVGASPLSECLHHNWARARRKLRRSSQSIATDGSWPDWHHYARRSNQLRSLWQRPNPPSADLFRRVLTADDIRPDPAAYQGNDLWLLLPMLTLKLWFEQWHS